MQTREKRKFSLLLQNFAVVYNKRLSKMTITLFWHCLNQFEFKLFKQALCIYLNDSQSVCAFPTPLQLQKIIKVLDKQSKLP